MRLAMHVMIDPQTVRLLRKMGRLVAEDAGLDETDAMAVEVSMGEALSNAFVHAYAGSSGPVAVEILREHGTLVVDIRDGGAQPPRTFEIPQHPPGPATDGRGLYMIKNLMDGLEVTHPADGGRGTRVRMMKRITGRGTLESVRQITPTT